MLLSLNEIKSRAIAFSQEWENTTSEHAEAKSFWDSFLNVFGVNRRRIASFEVPVEKSDGQGGFIDLLWKGVLLVEHKSKGKSLDKGLKDKDLSRYILVSDFARFRLYDLDQNAIHEFNLNEFYKNIDLLYKNRINKL